MYLLPGVIGFVFFILFDLNKIHWRSKALNLFFVLGSALLIISTGYCVLQSDFSVPASRSMILNLLFFTGLILSGAALIYALFFALPFGDTYVQSGDLPLINKGLYGVCRHPGFWMFAFFYLFLTLFCSDIRLLYCFFLYNICNFFYIVIQDIYIFPNYIHGYDEYKRTIPFLLPTGSSIRNAFSDTKRKNRRKRS